MDRKLSITERLAGSIRLDDQKLIDEMSGSSSIPVSPLADPSYEEHGCLWPSSWEHWPWACRSMKLPGSMA